jgi:hypothetical protein
MNLSKGELILFFVSGKNAKVYNVLAIESVTREGVDYAFLHEKSKYFSFCAMCFHVKNNVWTNQDAIFMYIHKYMHTYIRIIHTCIQKYIPIV